MTTPVGLSTNPIAFLSAALLMTDIPILLPSGSETTAQGSRAIRACCCITISRWRLQEALRKLDCWRCDSVKTAACTAEGLENRYTGILC